MFDVISPDGFSINPTEKYKTEKDAKGAFEIWKRRYKAQGYYSSNRGRIDLKDLFYFCKIVKIG